MRSSDIATRCREIALRVDASGEWGDLGDTLREAAAEVERLRLEPSVQEEIVAWSVDLHDAREEIKRLTTEVERLRMVIPNANEANAMLVAAQHIEAYLGRPGDHSILLRALYRRVRETQ